MRPLPVKRSELPRTAGQRSAGGWCTGAPEGHIEPRRPTVGSPPLPGQLRKGLHLWGGLSAPARGWGLAPKGRGSSPPPEGEGRREAAGRGRFAPLHRSGAGRHSTPIGIAGCEECANIPLNTVQRQAMAKPRVFVSSTFYDLRQVREDLDRFISGLGYEAVLHEAGDVAYGKDSPPEGYVHREIEMCDILICVIGGRYGTESQQQPGSSITQLELSTAIENQVQVFIFIEQDVYSEYRTYSINKETADIKYQFVDDPRVYEFIESVYRLPRNNPITSFQTASDIIEYLRNQWAGLFQRFLQDQKRIEEMRTLEEMKSVAGTLEQLVRFLTEERKDKDDAIQQILLANHPVFHRFQAVTRTPYRVFFTNEEELNRWLKARKWNPIDESKYDTGSYREWGAEGTYQYIKLTEAIFDEEGNLKVYTGDRWKDNWLQVFHETRPTIEDIPF